MAPLGQAIPLPSECATHTECLYPLQIWLWYGKATTSSRVTCIPRRIPRLVGSVTY
jgi:hypothetical protein